MRPPFQTIIRAGVPVAAYSWGVKKRVQATLARYTLPGTGGALNKLLQLFRPLKPVDLDPIYATFNVKTSAVYKLVGKYTGRFASDAIFVWVPGFGGPDTRIDGFIYEQNGDLAATVIIGKGSEAAAAMIDAPDDLSQHYLAENLGPGPKIVVKREVSEAFSMIVIRHHS